LLFLSELGQKALGNCLPCSVLLLQVLVRVASQKVVDTITASIAKKTRHHHSIYKKRDLDTITASIKVSRHHHGIYYKKTKN
jgi:hypothetical protein